MCEPTHSSPCTYLYVHDTPFPSYTNMQVYEYVGEINFQFTKKIIKSGYGQRPRVDRVLWMKKNTSMTFTFEGVRL